MRAAIVYRGRGPAGYPPHRIASLGIAHVPEGRGIFGNLTVKENLKLATWQRKDRAELAKDYKRIFDLFPVLYERREQSGGTLSGGEQQMLALGRALMGRGQTDASRRALHGTCARPRPAIFSRSSRRSTGRARPSCWSSRTPTCRSTPPPPDTCWRRV